MTCPDGFWCFQLKDLINSLVLIATIAAIVVAPISALKITREYEEKREQRKRQYDVFHALMKTRRLAMSPDRVASLNLVQLEFADDPIVLAQYKRYIEHHYIPAPDQEKARIVWLEDREDRLFDLLHTMGTNLGFTFDKRDLHKFSYAPQGWADDETQGRIFRQLLVELLSGRRALPVKEFKIDPNNTKFPPPPA